MAKISKLWASILKNALNILVGFISTKILDPIAQRAWLDTLEPTKDIIDALSDGDANDKEQVAAIVKEYTHDKAIPIAQEFTTAKIKTIKDEKLQQFLLIISDPVFSAGQLAVNETAENTPEILAYIEEWIEDAATQEVLLSYLLAPLLAKVIKNPEANKLILAQIKMQLGTINIDLNKDGQ